LLPPSPDRVLGAMPMVQLRGDDSVRALRKGFAERANRVLAAVDAIRAELA
jgi:hypothetical protein